MRANSVLAEGVGFEPTREREPPGGFQDRCLKPLGHPSLPGTSNIYACLAKEKTNLAEQFHRRRACYQVRREPANAVTRALREAASIYDRIDQGGARDHAGTKTGRGEPCHR